MNYRDRTCSYRADIPKAGRVRKVKMQQRGTKRITSMFIPDLSLFGLEGACADRVQAGMNMRGPSRPWRRKLRVKENFKKRTVRCSYTFSVINACMAALLERN